MLRERTGAGTLQLPGSFHGRGCGGPDFLAGDGVGLGDVAVPEGFDFLVLVHFRSAVLGGIGLAVIVATLRFRVTRR